MCRLRNIDRPKSKIVFNSDRVKKEKAPNALSQQLISFHGELNVFEFWLVLIHKVIQICIHLAFLPIPMI